jgi:large subunit ribosomal protein L29
MKVDELRVLEADELSVRLKTARRELYELRFKHAVGQLENSSQIGKVRHDIARIMTVLHEREFGIVATPQADAPLAGGGAEGAEVAPVGAGGSVTTAEAVEEAPAKPKRTRKKTEETK